MQMQINTEEIFCQGNNKDKKLLVHILLASGSLCDLICCSNPLPKRFICNKLKVNVVNLFHRAQHFPAGKKPQAKPGLLIFWLVLKGFRELFSWSCWGNLLNQLKLAYKRPAYISHNQHTRLVKKKISALSSWQTTQISKLSPCYIQLYPKNVLLNHWNLKRDWHRWMEASQSES